MRQATIHDRVVSFILLAEAWACLAIVAYTIWAGGLNLLRVLAATVAAVGWVYAREWRKMVLSGHIPPAEIRIPEFHLPTIPDRWIALIESFAAILLVAGGLILTGAIVGRLGW